MESFELWWEEVESYCKKEGISTEYFEDEFIVEGEDEFVEVQLLDELTGELL